MRRHCSWPLRYRPDPPFLGAVHRHREGLARGHQDWMVDPLAAGCATRILRRRDLPCPLRHSGTGRHRRYPRDPARDHGRHLPRRVRPRTVGEGDHIHGRRARGRALDRGRTVHLCAVDRNPGIPTEPVRGITGFGAADVASGRAIDGRELKFVPDELREASYALGIPQWKTIARVVVPTALPGIISGILLAIARVIGETAPVLVLVGYARSINFNVFDGNMASLPLLIYTELINPQPAGQMRVWGAALTLIIVVALLMVLASVATRLLTRKRWNRQDILRWLNDSISKTSTSTTARFTRWPTSGCLCYLAALPPSSGRRDAASRRCCAH